MGSRGSFLESGGFSTPAKWQTVNYIEGIKILERKDPNASISLPERSNTPGTTYISFDKMGIFKRLITFDEKRMPIYEIDFGFHNGKKSLHIHYYIEGNRQKNPSVIKPGDILYEKYKYLFKEINK